LPLLSGDKDVTVRTLDPLGSYVILRFNHLFPPFDDVRLRRAVLIATRQKEFMEAMGGDPALSRDCRSFFPCGTEYGQEAPAASMPGDMAEAARMVAASGYDGPPVLILSVSDKPYLSGLADVTADLLKRIGMKSELIAADWATILTRRASRKPPGEGGWNIVFTTGAAPEFADPAANILLSGAGEKAWIGWYQDARMEQLRRHWLYAPDAAERLAIARDMQTEAFATVPFVPLGQYRLATAFRSSVAGIVPSSAPLFWNLSVS
jgi:peptide/nickel transport system substrate-binding protein